MKDVIIVGLAFIGTLGVIADYWWINELIMLGVVESSLDLWIRLTIMFVLLLVPPYIMHDGDRRETARNVLAATGSGILEVVRLISIGFVLAIGIYIFNTVIA